MGEQMLRTSRASAEPTVDPNTIPPIFGVLVKSVLTYDKKWKHFAMFCSTEYEIIAANNTPYPDELSPTLHPGRIVCVRKDLVVPKSPISAAHLHIPDLDDIQRMNNINVLANVLPGGFGKIHYEPTGMHVKVMSSTYKSGPDDKVTFLRPIYNHKTNKHLLIPVSALNFEVTKETPVLEQSVLPQGTQVRFVFSPGLATGKTYACNLSLVTILPADNCYGSPPKKVESITQQQPGGIAIDLHVAPYGITLRSERCELLDKHLKGLIPTGSIALHIIHSNTTLKDPTAVSVGELDREFRKDRKCSWDQANLDQIVEMILKLKNSDVLNTHKTQRKSFTLVFTLANQNQQNVVSKNIADSYNLHKHTGHSFLHPTAGVLLVLQPTSFSGKGIAKVNAAQIFSKAHCSSLCSTHTYHPGYAVPYVKDKGKIVAGEVEQVLGTTLTHLSILTFADYAKSASLKEWEIPADEDAVLPFKLENNTITVQWKPSAGVGKPKNAILGLFENPKFLKLATVEEPKVTDRKRKFGQAIKTVFVTPRPGYSKVVLATLLCHKDVLVLPNDALDDDGFLVRSNRPYPDMAYDIMKHPGLQFGQYLSPFAFRGIFAKGYDFTIIPELLQLEKTVAHNDHNISLTPEAGSPWTEVFTNGAHATLGRTLSPPVNVCPNTAFFGGFTGYPTAEWLEDVLFLKTLGKKLKVVDSREETKSGGVFIQYLKSTIRPRNLHSKDTTISIFTCNDVDRANIADFAKLIEHFSSGSLYPVYDGLQFLTVQTEAVSSAKGAAMEEEALADITSIIEFSASEAEDVDPLDLYGHDHSIPAAVENPDNGDRFNEVPARNRRSNRSNKTADTTATDTSKPHSKVSSNTQQHHANKGNQYLALPADSKQEEDFDLFNDPGVVAAAVGTNTRKADAGDFDTTGDLKITHYFQTNLLGSKPEAQIKTIIKPVVTIWSREFPNYHKNQLGNNFNGKKKLGGLLSALGKSKFSLKPVMQMLNHNVRQVGAETLAKLCEKLEDYLDKQTEKAKPTNNTVTSDQQQKQSSQKPTNPAKPSATTPAGKQTANKSNKDKSATLADYFNPMSSLHVTDLTDSQGDKDNAIILDVPTEADEEAKHRDTAGTGSDDDDSHDAVMTGVEHANQDEPSATSGSEPHLSPSINLPAFKAGTVGSVSSADLGLPRMMMGGMPPIQISSPVTAVTSSGTNN